MYACRSCQRYIKPLHVIARIGKGRSFQYNPGVYLCGTCLNAGFSDDSLKLIHASDNILIVRDKKNKYRYDIIKKAIFTEQEDTIHNA